jgi:hypothetical protein
MNEFIILNYHEHRLLHKFSMEVDTFYLPPIVHELLLLCKFDPKVNFFLQLKKLYESNYKTWGANYIIIFFNRHCNVVNKWCDFFLFLIFSFILFIFYLYIENNDVFFPRKNKIWSFFFVFFSKNKHHNRGKIPKIAQLIA